MIRYTDPRPAAINCPEDGYYALLAAVFLQAFRDLRRKSGRAGAQQFLCSPGAAAWAEYLDVNLPAVNGHNQRGR